MNDALTYREKIKNDLLQQFKGKPNTEALVSAFAKQLQEVFLVFEDLKQSRSLEAAARAQLDGIGDIVVLTRAQAGALESKNKGSKEMDDERYREYLKYKIFVNTSTGTYKDVHKSLRMFWDRTPIYYAENPDYPATMFFSTPTLSPEDNASRLFQIPVIKAAGVALRLTATTQTPIEPVTLRVGGAVFSGILSTKLPQIIWEYHCKERIHVVPRAENITQTVLPPIA